MAAMAPMTDHYTYSENFYDSFTDMRLFLNDDALDLSSGIISNLFI